MIRAILTAVLLCLAFLAPAHAQSPYPFYPCYYRYTNNGDTTSAFHFICQPGQTYYAYPPGLYVPATGFTGGGFTVNSHSYAFRSSPGQTPSSQNNWSGAPWTFTVNGCGESYGWTWKLTNSTPYGFGDYTTESCFDQNGNPVSAPNGTWTLMLGPTVSITSPTGNPDFVAVGGQVPLSAEGIPPGGTYSWSVSPSSGVTLS